MGISRSMKLPRHQYCTAMPAPAREGPVLCGACYRFQGSGHPAPPSLDPAERVSSLTGAPGLWIRRVSSISSQARSRSVARRMVPSDTPCCLASCLVVGSLVFSGSRPDSTDRCDRQD